jgi:hypothetical protein
MAGPHFACFNSRFLPHFYLLLQFVTLILELRLTFLKVNIRGELWCYQYNILQKLNIGVVLWSMSENFSVHEEYLTLRNTSKVTNIDFSRSSF